MNQSISWIFMIFVFKDTWFSADIREFCNCITHSFALILEHSHVAYYMGHIIWKKEYINGDYCRVARCKTFCVILNRIFLCKYIFNNYDWETLKIRKWVQTKRRKLWQLFGFRLGSYPLFTLKTGQFGAK